MTNATTKIATTNAMLSFAEVRDDLSSTFMERDDEIDGLMTALAARQHVLLLGPPGTAKSALAGAMCKAIGGNYFSWLMTRFTTPEEVFGPISISGMKKDSYRRLTGGMLPEADVAFMDEIFKSNSAILNAMLSLINERVYYNDGKPTTCPLQTMVGASNELPEDESLEAMFDRFALRYHVDYLTDDDNFDALLDMDEAPRISATMTMADLAAVQDLVSKVALPKDVKGALKQIKRNLLDEGIVVSDRRWVQIVRVIQAAAVVRVAVQIRAMWDSGNQDQAAAQALIDDLAVDSDDDLMILAHSIWRTPDQMAIVREKVGQVANPAVAEARAKLDACVEEHRALIATEGIDDFLTVATTVRANMKVAMMQIDQLIADHGASNKVKAIRDELARLQSDAARRHNKALS